MWTSKSNFIIVQKSLCGGRFLKVFTEVSAPEWRNALIYAVQDWLRVSHCSRTIWKGQRSSLFSRWASAAAFSKRPTAPDSGGFILAAGISARWSGMFPIISFTNMREFLFRIIFSCLCTGWFHSHCCLVLLIYLSPTLDSSRSWTINFRISACTPAKESQDSLEIRYNSAVRLCQLILYLECL